MFTDPTFNPQIGLFQLAGGKAVLRKTIVLKDARRHGVQRAPEPGDEDRRERGEDRGPVRQPDRPDPAVHRAGHQPDGQLDPDDGYDSEGLVALPDGTFWVSDEYGPFITHFDTNGKEIERLSPWGADATARHRPRRHRAPAAARAAAAHQEQGHGGPHRHARRPDAGRHHAVGADRARLRPGSNGKTVKPANVAPVRIVTVDLQDQGDARVPLPAHQPGATTGSAVSEITALSDTKFLVDERDGNQGEPGQAAFKDLYEIDLTGATDVNGDGADPLGYTIGGKSIDAYVGDAPHRQGGVPAASRPASRPSARRRTSRSAPC